LAFTPWGELAFRLAGGPGYGRVRNSDQARIAPGAETLAELLKGGPALILLDELGVYLRKAGSRDLDAAAGQLTAFLTALFKAVEATPRAALVFTLALGKLGQGAGDAYRDENLRIAKAMDEAASVAARKATLLEPTGEDEAALILRRRLFERIDGDGAANAAAAYGELWSRHAAVLPAPAAGESREERLQDCYPFHPELIDLLKEKTSTLADFQRIRGMLRLLSRVVAQV
jgi:predicted AAA+ superfamily ATPase